MVLAVLDHAVGRKNRVVPSCVTTPWTMKLLPKSICIHKGSVVVFATHASSESSMDRALLVPGAASSYADEYVRAASGGFVTTTTASWYLPAAQLAHAPELEAPIAAEVLPAGQSVQASRTSV